MANDKKISKELATRLAKAAKTMHYFKDTRPIKPVKKKPTK